MATSDAAPRAARRRRSLVFYAWAVFIGQVLLGLGAVVFVLIGSSHQRAAIQTNDRVRRLQLTNLAMQADFLDASRALRGYELTGQNRFLESYYTERVQFSGQLRTARDLAWQEILPGLVQAAGTASAAFHASDRALGAPRGGRRARAALEQAGLLSDRYVTVSDRLQARLSALSGQLTAESLQALGIGLAGTAAVVLTGLLIPAVMGAMLVSRTVVPLHRTTGTVRRLAVGDHAARAVPTGPAETRELAASINFLAGENDRLRAEQEERVRLTAMARDTAARIRAHLDAEGVIREAVRAIRQNLVSDYVWVSMFADGGMILPPGNPSDLGLLEATVRSVPSEYPDYLGFMQDLYERRSSYEVDLESPEAAALPALFGDAVRSIGGRWLLSVPFGSAQKVLGNITLLRTGPGRPWTPTERAAVESVGLDLARGLDHARLYEQQKELVSKLKEVDRAKSDFLAAVSHDLRTPLTSIVGYTEMLDEDQAHPLSDGQHQMIGAIDRNADRLRNLIEDVLTMSKIEMGEFRTVLAPVDLAAVAREAAGDIRGAAEAKGLTFTVRGPERGLLVSGSADQLGRALTNVLSNAVKYTPVGGSVDVTASQEDSQAVVSVSDTGIGIPEQDQPSLFTRFYRASNVATGSIPGTGLGLAIVRTIVENHHGEIALRSQEGAGTTVTVRLPLLPGGPQAVGGQQGGQQ